MSKAVRKRRRGRTKGEQMIRRYCDCCNTEMTPANTPQWGTTGGRLAAVLERNGVTLGVEVIQSANGTSNAGDFCKHCIIDAINQMDDRPVMRLVQK